LPARELEDRVAAALREMLDDESSVLEAAQKTDIDSSRIERVLHAARSWSRLLQSEAEQTAALAALVDRVELKCDGIRVSIKLPIADAETSRAQSIVGIGTELLAHREKIEVVRHGSPCARSPVPMPRAHRHCTRAVCALANRVI
jgi:hypothetical protein